METKSGKKTLLQRVSNGELETGLLILAAIVLAVSLIDDLSQVFLLVMVVVAPFVIGHSVALLFDYMDSEVDYKVHFSDSSHLKLAAVTSLIMGVLLSKLATQVPLIPYTPFTNSVLLIVSPNVVFFLFGIIGNLVGYWFAWKTFSNKTKR